MSPIEKYNFKLSSPGLVVIAEGANSTSRARMGIPFVPVAGLEEEHWCSGSVSLDQIAPKEMECHISLTTGESGNTTAFGVFRPKYHDLFLNGQSETKLTG